MVCGTLFAGTLKLTPVDPCSKCHQYYMSSVCTNFLYEPKPNPKHIKAARKMLIKLNADLSAAITDFFFSLTFFLHLIFEVFSHRFHWVVECRVVVQRSLDWKSTFFLKGNLQIILRKDKDFKYRYFENEYFEISKLLG